MSVTKNDPLIDLIIEDPDFQIFPDGKVLTRISRQGHRTNVWRPKGLCIQKCNERTSYARIRYEGKLIPLHRVIYRKFKGPLNPGLQINHVDGNGLNNRAENLELVSISENNRHKYRVLGHKGVKGFAKINMHIAGAIRFQVSCGFSPESLAEQYGVSKATIISITNNKTWKAS